MTPERWHQIDNLFQAVIELEPAERELFLDSSCAGDEELRREVESLISSDDEGVSFIDGPALEAAATLLADPQPVLNEGQHFANYEVIRLLGRGGMGEVYLAEDKKLKRKVALKLLPADYTTDKERLRRFQQEAQAASALNHPNILTIHELGDVNDRQFIATEFVDGETLRERLQRDPISLSEALGISIEVASALAAAHRAGIIHRDIKPENIMLRPDGYVKVVDFGLAKLTDQHERVVPTHTADSVDISSGLVMGTVKYMSPEQAQSKGVDGRSDIFSLGVVLYEMLTGRAAFEGKNTREVIHSILKKDPAPLSHLAPGIPAELERIVGKAMSKSKETRYENAENLLADLKQLSHTQQAAHSQAAIPTAHMGNSLIRDGEATALSSTQVFISRFRENRIGLAFVFATLLVVIGVAIYALKNSIFVKQATSFEHASVTTLALSEGLTGAAAISPDGGLIAFESQRGVQTRLLLSSGDGVGSPTQLLPSGEAGVYGLVFSHDGQSLYFNRAENGNSALFRISISGGNAVKLFERVDSRIALSPVGHQLAFIRDFPSEGESALIVANVDSGEEKRIAMLKGPLFFSGKGPAWSPDGKTIASIVEGGSVNQTALATFDVTNGVENKINTPVDWPRIADIGWGSNGGLVVIVTEGFSTAATQIWQLSGPDWSPKRIGGDEKFYESISVARYADVFLAVERKRSSDIWITPLSGNSEPKQMTNTASSGRGGVCWLPDGTIIYHARARGIDALWRSNPDGTNPQKLTGDNRGNFYPSVPVDGRYSIFMSSRTGTLHVWRHENATGQQIQLTSGRDEQFPQVSPDGKWVYYVSWDGGVGTVWKVSINGGQPSRVISEASSYPELSPDGNLLAYVGFEDERPLRKVVALADGNVRHTFRGPLARFWIAHWSRSGDALLYIDRPDGFGNVWSQPLAGGQPQQLTHFSDGRIYFFDQSHDGKNLVLSRGAESRALVLFRSR